MCQAVLPDHEVKKAINSSCRMLAIREHSHQQIRIKLAKKGFSEVSIESTIDYLVQENWISEARFCESYIRSKSSRGQGLKRILYELRQHNIDPSLIENAVIEESVDWLGSCKKVLAKKMNTLNVDFASEYNNICESNKIDEISLTTNQEFQHKQKYRTKLESFLNYRGFSNEEIRSAMKDCKI